MGRSRKRRCARFARKPVETSVVGVHVGGTIAQQTDDSSDAGGSSVTATTEPVCFACCSAYCSGNSVCVNCVGTDAAANRSAPLYVDVVRHRQAPPEPPAPRPVEPLPFHIKSEDFPALPGSNVAHVAELVVLANDDEQQLISQEQDCSSSVDYDGDVDDAASSISEIGAVGHDNDVAAAAIANNGQLFLTAEEEKQQQQLNNVTRMLSFPPYVLEDLEKDFLNLSLQTSNPESYICNNGRNTNNNNNDVNEIERALSPLSEVNYPLPSESFIPNALSPTCCKEHFSFEAEELHMRIETLLKKAAIRRPRPENGTISTTEISSSNIRAIANTIENSIPLSVATGIEANKLGIDIYDPMEQIHPSFAGPYTVYPCSAHDMLGRVPHEYIINGHIRLNLPKVNQMKAELLFYFFHLYPGDMMQLLAAAQLYERGWRFYIGNRVWIRHQEGNPKYVVINKKECGIFNFFSYNNWLVRERYFEIDANLIEKTLTTLDLMQLYGQHPLMK